jgi:hypothetical protein
MVAKFKASTTERCFAWPWLAGSEAKIGPTDLGIIQELGGGAGLNNSACLQNISSVRMLQRYLDILVHQ